MITFQQALGNFQHFQKRVNKVDKLVIRKNKHQGTEKVNQEDTKREKAGRAKEKARAKRESREKVYIEQTEPGRANRTSRSKSKAEKNKQNQQKHIKQKEFI